MVFYTKHIDIELTETIRVLFLYWNDKFYLFNLIFALNKSGILNLL